MSKTLWRWPESTINRLVYESYAPKRLGLILEERVIDTLHGPERYVRVVWEDGGIGGRVSNAEWDRLKAAGITSEDGWSWDMYLQDFQSLIEDHEKKLKTHKASETRARKALEGKRS